MNEALSSLRAALASGAPPPLDEAPLPAVPNVEYAIRRFLNSWARSGRFGADEAVLLRQAVRWSRTPLEVGIGPDSFGASVPHLAKANVRWSADGAISAIPFAPAWLPDLGGSDGPPTERRLDESFPAEAYLQSISYSKWRSPAQKEAAWCVLSTPAGHTRIIVLPTGAGKSLCFQLLPRFNHGLTVVIVPTVALAIDQQSVAMGLLRDLPNVNPCFFASGEESDSKVQMVKNRETRLVFASPEACVRGRLRAVLDEFARSGWLENLVIDEAHMIETWGAQFRVDFQVLSAARQNWLAQSQSRLRTFLFSATMTAECRKTLGELFSDEGGGAEFVCQRLRPEISFFGRRITDPQARDEAVIDALWNLPRPAILYVTERAEAEQFFQRLSSEGFQRLGCFHGKTTGADRHDLLRRWKGNEIDLMVATSAFGLGVDKPDVRTVIHACYPENLDRYYQEVGRGGRDGWSSVSLMVPTAGDRTVAEGIMVRLMTPAMMQARWEAMLSNGIDKGDYTFELPMKARRAGFEGTRTYAENESWNKRLLLQLHRAKKLKLQNLRWVPNPEAPEEPREEWAEVRMNVAPHSPELGESIASHRDEEMRYFYRGLAQVEDFLSGQKCASRVLASLYNVESDQRVCAGCQWCRQQGRSPLHCPALAYPHADASPDGRAAFIDKCPTPFEKTGRSEFLHLVHQSVVVKRVSQFFCPEAQFRQVLDWFREVFPNDSLDLYRLDPISEGAQLGAYCTTPLAFFHFGGVSQAALEFARQQSTIHFLCGISKPHDSNGRHVSANFARASLWASPQSWLVST